MRDFGLSQARGHRDVIARFGRHPQRNTVLRRASTPEEAAYIERGEFVHNRRPVSDWVVGRLARDGWQYVCFCAGFRMPANIRPCMHERPASEKRQGTKSR
jgi:hypothetical protein